MKKNIIFLITMLLTGSLFACGQYPESEDASALESPDGNEGAVVHDPPPDEPVLTKIIITTEEGILEGVLFDNDTARGLAEMLPLTVSLWHPAPGFAKAFDHLEQTIVPVVTVGRITSDVDFLEEYRGEITITGKER